MLTDLFVIVIYFLAIFCIGIYAGRRQNSLTDYALGNRSLPWWAILASILAAEISAATFLGAPGEGYHTRNFTYAQLCIGTILGRIIVGRLFLKPYYDYKVVSIYEYLEKRFGLLTRRTASMVFLISRVLASGTRLYFAGILLVIAYQFLTGVTADADQIVLLYIAALVAISVATTIYTAIGGLKAVVWTDVLQAVVLGVSMLSALWVLFSHIPGGWSSISAAMNGGDDWKFFSWGTGEGLDFLQQGARVLGQEYTVWAAFLGATFITMATHGTDQDMVQRMLAAKNSKAGTRAVIVSGLLDFPIVIIFLFTGILLYVFYQYNPANLPADTPQLHVFPYFIIHELPNGIRGLLIAGLLATAMGSLSTALNSLATTATKDWYQGIFKPEAAPVRALGNGRFLPAAHPRGFHHSVVCGASPGSPHHPNSPGHFRLYLWLPAWHFPVGNADPHQRQRLRKHHCHGGRILCHRFTDGTHPSALRLATICSGNSISVARYHRNSGYFYRRLLFQKAPPSHALNGERRSPPRPHSGSAFPFKPPVNGSKCASEK